MIQNEYETEDAKLLLNCGKWKQAENLEAVGRMKEWKVAELRLQENFRVELVKDILHIQFTHLTSLCMWQNNIESVEALPRIMMPRLKYLQFSTNNIKSIRTLRKANWCLSHFYIYENYICDSGILAQTHLPTLTYLGVHERSIRGKDSLADSPLFVAKLQTSLLQELGIDVGRFRNQCTLRRVISRKWEQMVIN